MPIFLRLPSSKIAIRLYCVEKNKKSDGYAKRAPLNDLSAHLLYLLVGARQAYLEGIYVAEETLLRILNLSYVYKKWLHEMVKCDDRPLGDTDYGLTVYFRVHTNLPIT